jgi:hypothetical protein
MQIRLWFFDDETTECGVGVLRQFAQHDRHENQVVAVQSVTLDVEHIDNERHTGRQLGKVAEAAEAANTANC